MAMRGALQLQLPRRSSMRVGVPEFTMILYARRYNMKDEYRIKWYNWNLACIGLTFVTLARMYTVSYRNSEERATLNRCGAP